MLDKNNVVAVVGASRNPEKYGHRVYKDLKQAGYKVFPVNPNADEVLGDKCYPNLVSLPRKPEVVNLVVQPPVTEQTVKECRQLGIKMVWMQPGSESEEAIKHCTENGVQVVYGECIMVQRRRLQQPP
jgi:predicted CoA-binding protein